MSFWKLDFRLAKMSIREGHKTRHRCSLSKLMSALCQKRTLELFDHRVGARDSVDGISRPIAFAHGQIGDFEAHRITPPSSFTEAWPLLRSMSICPRHELAQFARAI
jgi:hypothetical protein